MRRGVDPLEPSRQEVTGVVLAGGRGLRMGGRDKGLVGFAGRPLVEWVIEALKPQVGSLVISANRNLESYTRYGFQVIEDLEPGYQGPLAGILSALRVARTEWVLTLPCDGPRPPPDLRERLAEALTSQGAELAIATEGSRRQPLHALLPVRLADSLAAFLGEGKRTVEQWYDRHSTALADFGDRPDCFANLNSPDQARSLERSLLEGLQIPDASSRLDGT